MVRNLARLALVGAALVACGGDEPERRELPRCGTGDGGVRLTLAGAPVAGAAAYFHDEQGTLIARCETDALGEARIAATAPVIGWVIDDVGHAIHRGTLVPPGHVVALAAHPPGDPGGGSGRDLIGKLRIAVGAHDEAGDYRLDVDGAVSQTVDDLSVPLIIPIYDSGQYPTGVVVVRGWAFPTSVDELPMAYQRVEIPLQAIVDAGLLDIALNDWRAEFADTITTAALGWGQGVSVRGRGDRSNVAAVTLEDGRVQFRFTAEQARGGVELSASYVEGCDVDMPDVPQPRWSSSGTLAVAAAPAELDVGEIPTGPMPSGLAAFMHDGRLLLGATVEQASPLVQLSTSLAGAAIIVQLPGDHPTLSLEVVDELAEAEDYEPLSLGVVIHDRSDLDGFLDLIDRGATPLAIGASSRSSLLSWPAGATASGLSCRATAQPTWARTSRARAAHSLPPSRAR
jgi:hypothetical protein